MRAILLLQVDGDEQTPIGVYPGLLEARDAMVEDALRYMDTLELQRQATDVVLANLQEELDSVRRTDDTLDIQFESGTGSWDYRLVYVPVYSV